MAQPRGSSPGDSRLTLLTAVDFQVLKILKLQVWVRSKYSEKVLLYKRRYLEGKPGKFYKDNSKAVPCSIWKQD